MLRWAPSQLRGDSCTVVILPAHQRPVFLFPCTLWSHAVRWNSRGGPQSSPGVFVNMTRLAFGMCIYFFSALWSKQLKPQILLETVHFGLNTQIVDLSFFPYAWTDLITCIQFSLFIQLALCFTLPCFIYGSHVLWLQLQGGDPKA